MEGIQASSAASMAQGVLKDTTGADVISKTLNNMHGGQGGGSSAAIDNAYQFSKDVMNAAGIGTKLDTVA